VGVADDDDIMREETWLRALEGGSRPLRLAGE
jgi:hypothetical protein